MGKGNKVEFFVAICALVSSIIAVFVAWDQAKIMRLQQRAEVWPLLQIEQVTDADGETLSYALSIENAGVGPALIERYVVAIPGGDPAISEDLVAFSSYMMAPEMGAGRRNSRSLDDRVLRQGDGVDVFRIFWPQTDERLALMLERVDLFTTRQAAPAVVFICYCSILEECWVESSESDSRPREVRQCNGMEGFAHEYLRDAAPPVGRVSSAAPQ